MLKPYPDELMPYAIAARKRWSRITPFRLGGEVGRAGKPLPVSPYREGSSADRNYIEGYAWGKEWRERHPVREEQGSC